MRIDKLLWQLRLTKSRSIAQALVGRGHIRRNGQRVVRASQDIVAGDTLTIPLPAGVQVIEIAALPSRRGPAAEALACYRVLDPTRQTAIAGQKDQSPERGQLP
ncbi:RNA-binding S4 domain-containing protein [Tsuneonella flava]|uniref:RNA-binding S4 domain-containing protein n=1 Tax=Tsuneonella flava TaxID=2055955 RepID=A0ABX7KAS0_9SPHN|nr:RNA-binding S4 domain-containing protein [Tsuneonella flava]QSB45062.1 RNA-binding S4 domain-containing protein [Tsuneonella flava]